ncbi:MAG: class I SAM-dependent methyltransferase [Pirellulaceae bacterium]
MNEPVPGGSRLFDIPGGWQACTLDVCGVSLRMMIPADPESVLDAHVAAVTASGSPDEDEFPDPYWATIWSAATPTAEAVMGADWPPQATVLELGCGVGLVGLAALVRGWHVTFSDNSPHAVRLALENARQNGFPHAGGMLLDWHRPPTASYDVMLASDVLYQRANHACLLQTIDQLMAPQGICWIGDPGRLVARKFLQAAGERFRVQLFDRDGHEFGVPHVGEFQRFVLRRRESS